jgi:hypothetical protein
MVAYLLAYNNEGRVSVKLRTLNECRRTVLGARASCPLWHGLHVRRGNRPSDSRKATSCHDG